MIVLALFLLALMLPIALSNLTLGKLMICLRCDGCCLAKIYNWFSSFEPYKGLGLREYQTNDLNKQSSMITTLYENTTQLAIRILTILSMRAYVVNVCLSKTDTEGIEFCSTNELNKFYQDQWDTICLTIWTLISIGVKIWLLRQEHKKIGFDI